MATHGAPDIDSWPWWVRMIMWFYGRCTTSGEFPR
jgi:hypothetical protein